MKVKKKRKWIMKEEGATENKLLNEKRSEYEKKRNVEK